MEQAITINSKKQRLHYIDFAKGVLIILLLFSHYSAATHRLDLNITYNYYFNIWQNLFICFYMQCFFLISGYCTNFKKNPNSFLSGLAKQLLLPYCTFMLIDLFGTMILSRNISLESFLEPISTPPHTGMWFLLALLFSKFLIWFLMKIQLRDMTILFVTLICLILAIVANHYNIGENILCYQNSLGACFFVMIGYMLKNNEVAYLKILTYSPYVFVFSIILCVVIKVVPVFTASIFVTPSTIPLFLVVSLSGSISFLLLCKYFRANRFFEYLGRNSLIIYGVHFIPLLLFINIFSTFIIPNSVNSFLLFLFMVYLSEIVVCILLIQFFNLKYVKVLVGKF